MASEDRISAAKRANEKAILAHENVVGVGVGHKTVKGRKTDQLSIIVLVERKLPETAVEPKSIIPRTVEDIPTDILEVGQLRAFQARTDRWRPAPAGVSVGHYQITAGTFGCVVKDRASGERLLLSNNHVLANSNDATPGDPILQPGPADGGTTSNDTFAHLERFCPIEFSVAPSSCDTASAYVSFGNLIAEMLGSSHRVQAYQVNPQAVNLVDAAVAKPVDDTQMLDEILEIGAITGITTPTLGMQVRKSGRTTGLTTGTIDVIDATVNVSYGSGRTATFERQLVAGPMSQGGDSGSLVVAASTLLAVGLLFAGSEQSTIFSPIQNVLDCLEVNI